jgi:chromate transporter
LSFGGPAGQISVMHRIVVDEKKWIREDQFLHALNFCMLLPGPEAQQLATYIGWLIHGMRGGLIAGCLFVLPGFVSILLLSLLYVTYQNSSFLEGIFFGLKSAVLVIVVQAVMRIGGRVLKSMPLVLISVSAFLALLLFQVPFPAIIVLAAAVGYLLSKFAPESVRLVSAHGSVREQEASPQRPSIGKSAWRALVVLLVGLILWFGPLIAIIVGNGVDNVFVRQHLFFSKAAVVTFGGAYSVLTYVAQEAVERYHWLSPTEMLDGLGLAETTPGPLIMVVEFVAFLGAYREPAGLSPMAAGILGAVLTTWVTFVPCFIWVFLGAPFVERLRGMKGLSASLTGITASVVGVVLHLAVWFALHACFRVIHEKPVGPMLIRWPDLTSMDAAAVAIAVVSAVCLFRLKRSVFETLALAVLLGVAGKWLGWVD